MNIFKEINRYEPCSGYKVVEIIDDILKEKGTGLTNDQKRILRTDFDMIGMYGNLNIPFQVFLWKEKKVEGKSPLWRLTLPILFLYTLIVYWFFGLFRWLLFGKFQLNPNSFNYNLIQNWYNKVF